MTDLFNRCDACERPVWRCDPTCEGWQAREAAKQRMAAGICLTCDTPGHDKLDGSGECRDCANKRALEYFDWRR